MNTYNIDKMYENYSSEIEKMQKCIDELQQENEKLKADYGTQAQIERDMLQQENKILKENAENNDKVVDKVNWKNQLLKKENKQLKEELVSANESITWWNNRFNAVTRDNKHLKDNWNKLKDYIKETKLKEFEKSYGKRYGKTFTQAELIVCNMILDKMQELEGSDE